MKTSNKGLSISLLLLSVLFYTCTDDGIELPYRTYSSLINQVATDAPTENILTNQLDISITWSRLAEGKYEGKLSREIDVNSTTIIIQLQELNRIATGGFQDASTIQLHVLDRFNVYDTRDGLSNAQLEIKQFQK